MCPVFNNNPAQTTSAEMVSTHMVVEVEAEG
jgi:hypothetical protein